MGYFDALSQSSFKRTEDGHTAFYPGGTRGAGYILKDEEQYQKVRSFLQRTILSPCP